MHCCFPSINSSTIHPCLPRLCTFGRMIIRACCTFACFWHNRPWISTGALFQMIKFFNYIYLVYEKSNMRCNRNKQKNIKSNIFTKLCIVSGSFLNILIFQKLFQKSYITITRLPVKLITTSNQKWTLCKETQRKYVFFH